MSRLLGVGAFAAVGLIALGAVTQSIAFASERRVAEVVVLRTPGVDPSELSRAAGMKLRLRQTRSDGAEVYRLARRLAVGSATLESVLEGLETLPGVVYAEPVLRLRAPRAKAHASTSSASGSPEETDSVAHLMVQPVPGRALDETELTRLSKLAGVGLQVVRPMSGGALVLRMEPPVGAAAAVEISRLLRADPAVRNAAPDGVVRPAAALPNDPELAAQKPLLAATASERGAANVVGAWNVTQGSGNVTVAILDTGIYRSHRDLDQNRLLDGYDFVSAISALGANDAGLSADGDGRDENESDPIVEESKCNNKQDVLHGTYVAGIIGARTDNAEQIAGVDWRAKILPIRVLGACNKAVPTAGAESDLIDGLRWAAGLPVPGVRANLFPAKVINLSLRIGDTCDSMMQAAVNDALGTGAIVVAGVGNFGGAVSSPASCSGVIAVAGHSIEDGSNDNFSNFGPGIEISAPYDGYRSLWLLDPQQNGQLCPTAIVRSARGTSFGAALVSGTVALMAAAQPGINASRAARVLKRTAVPFEPGKCKRDVGECGSGRLDAGAALAMIAPPDLPATAEAAVADATRTAPSLAAMPEPPTISAGLAHTCARVNDGDIVCWGRNTAGQLGDGTHQGRDAPVGAVVGDKMSTVAAGWSHSCAIVGQGASAGAVKCWGSNSSGEVGDGTGTDRPIPTLVQGLSRPAEWVVTGDGFSCALLDDGTVRCWGANAFGQLGDGTRQGRSAPAAPVQLGGKAIAIAAGQSHACVILDDRSVKCWGGNLRAQLGDPVLCGFRGPPGPPRFACDDSVVPVAVSDLGGDATTLDAGREHTCVTLSGGRARCWGAVPFGFGELGWGDTSGSLSPVDVISLGGNAMQIEAGEFHTCALVRTSLADSGGERDVVRCWGRNARLGQSSFTIPLLGQLGDPEKEQSDRPVSATTDCIVIEEIAAGGQHTCLRDIRGRIQCWGNGEDGQLGAGTKVKGFASTPVEVKASAVSSLDLGFSVGCAVSGGFVSCWGYGDLGVGDSSPAFSASPRPIDATNVRQLEGRAQAVSVGPLHACAVSNEGEVGCWGDNFAGQLGDGTRDPRSVAAAVVGLAGPVKLLSANGFTSCALLRDDGAVQCWGNNQVGQLGSGSEEVDSPIPVSVVGISEPAIDISVGAEHACAVMRTGEVACWGSNQLGQIGDEGGGGTRRTAVLVKGLGLPAVRVFASERSTCALLASGQLRCWGGLLGDASGKVTISLGEPVRSMCGNCSGLVDGVPCFNHACALLESGKVMCWGGNRSGALGNGTLVDSSVPTLASGLNDATAISCDEDRSCAVIADGTVRCWGSNLLAQLGDGTAAATPFAVAVEGVGLSFCSDERATLVGSDLDDVLTGTAQRDVIVAFGGNDSIDGKKGDDLICGGTGDDRIFGGKGNDELLGDAGNDLLVGGKGDDTIAGGGGSDELQGAAGSDTLDGGAGDDVCLGQAGQDVAVKCERVGGVP